MALNRGRGQILRPWSRSALKAADSLGAVVRVGICGLVSCGQIGAIGKTGEQSRDGEKAADKSETVKLWTV